MSAEHSPLPWSYVKHGNTRHIFAAGDNICSLFCDERYYPWCSEVEADWEFIVRAVNSHDELLAALKAIIEADECKSVAMIVDALPAARAAIAKAEGR